MEVLQCLVDRVKSGGVRFGRGIAHLHHLVRVDVLVADTVGGQVVSHGLVSNLRCPLSLKLAEQTPVCGWCC